METCMTEEGDYLENENILSPEEVLEHHGIKGQRWGVRRFQNKDGSYTDAGKKRYGFEGTGKSRKELNSERQSLYREKYNELTRDLDKLKSDAINYGLKNGLDLDDGGGGNGRDKNAGQKYMKMWERIEDLETEATIRANQYANEKFIERYGKQTVNKLEQRNSIVAQGKALAGIIIAASGAMLVSNLKQKREAAALHEWVRRG